MKRFYNLIILKHFLEYIPKKLFIIKNKENCKCYDKYIYIINYIEDFHLF